MILDIKNFYLINPIRRYKYLRLKMENILEDLNEQYNLREKTTSNGYIYAEVEKGM